ncbi:MAG: hypothetical protein RLZZ248_1720 [Bacteroidota bacterium]|jgi:hypothetical protein
MNKLYDYLFSDSMRHRLELVTVFVAIIGFFVHLALIALNKLTYIKILDSDLLQNPINSIYTPFSFILIYEIYLLVYFLPRSFTTTLLKQFEIISLILIRRVFGDITKIDFTIVSFSNTSLVNLFIDLAAVLILAVTILYFNKMKERLTQQNANKEVLPSDLLFGKIKKTIAAALILLLVIISGIHIFDFSFLQFTGNHAFPTMKNDLNSIFYKDFFTALILTDVLILLISYGFSQDYFRLLRNTGFVIATILLRLSFGATGLLNVVFVITGAFFGLAILSVFLNYQKEDMKTGI